MRLRTKPTCYTPSSYFPIAATAAARFLAGEVGSQDFNVDTLMWWVLTSLANGGAGIADATCASAALSELGIVEVPQPKRWRKDGFASGFRVVRPETSFVSISLNGRHYVLPVVGPKEYDKASRQLTKQLSRKRRPSVGVLKEG